MLLRFEELAKCMRVHATPELQVELEQLREANEDNLWGTDKLENAFLSDELIEAGYEWVRPEECGDLTDAPMFGLRASELPIPDGTSKEEIRDLNVTEYGFEAKNGMFCPPVKRWAYMNYALRSFLDDLADRGFADFEAGHETDPEALMNNFEESTDVMRCAKANAVIKGEPEPTTPEQYLHYMKVFVESLETPIEVSARIQHQIDCLEALGVGQNTVAETL